jgi:NADP-dependent 3-hydroxy acid dehydrogenase YdfG
MKSIKGLVAVVTGGGSGIGREVAISLCKEGVRVVICGRRQASLDETMRMIQGEGGAATAVQADVSKEQDVDRLVKAALSTYGTLDILINNAGVLEGSRIHEADVEDWDQVMAINLRGPFLMARAILPIFRKKSGGHIINISSESGLNYFDRDGIYGLSKHALNDLGEYIQRENQLLNIRVNTICPGMVVTEMTQNDPGLNHSKCLYPEDIADLVLWLLTRRDNIKIGTPILIQTMENPWET